MKKLIFTLVLTLVSTAMMAQNSGSVKGSIISRTTKAAIQDATLILKQEGVEQAKIQTKADGSFKFESVADGSYEIAVSANEYLPTSVFCVVEKGLLRDLRTITLTPDRVVEETDDASFSEFDMNDSGYSNNPTILTGSNDPFTSVASFGFSNMRWRPRGFESGTQDVYLAGVRVNDALTGNTPYSLWSGLNEATRSKNSEHGMGAIDYTIGGYNGVTNIQANAASVRKGWRFSALTNSALYRLRLMATYASGPLDNGWSYAFSASARLGGNDWVKGVYYRSFAFYAGAEKKFDDGRHNLSMAIFGAPGKRGAQTASTQEVYDLMGDNCYNSNWGYQDGKIRNSRERRTFEPVMYLKYTFKPNDDLIAHATVLYRTGWNGYTALDWFNSADPRPDYYKNLPSYFYLGEEDGDDYNKQSPLKAGYAAEQWKLHNTNYCHIDWDRMYNINRNSYDKYSATERRSKYVQEERHVDQNDVNLALHSKWRQSSLFTLNGGINGKYNRTEYYKKIADLLGGDYYVNINNFAERDFAMQEYRYQQDLDYYVAHGQAQMVRTGDKYGYDYFANIYKINGWAVGSFTVEQFKADVSFELGGTTFWREGVWRNGLFAGYKDGTTEPYTLNGKDITVKDAAGNIITSKGKSDVASFLTYRAKLKLEYNFQGGHRIWLNGGYFNDAPEFAQSFISARTRNSLIPNLTTMKTISTDINYAWAANGYSVRVTGFYNYIKDKTDLLSFYDDMQASFTNVAMWGIGERHAGVELGFAIPLVLEGLSLKGALSYSNNVYTTTPYMTQTVDNSAATVVENMPVKYWTGTPTFKQNSDGSYEKGLDGNYIETGRTAHHVSGSPELASSLSLNYRTKSYWFFTLEGQAFAGNYLDMNPLYRTEAACAGPDQKHLTPESIAYMTAQEEFAPAFLLNASIGKSWYLHYKYNFGFSLNLNNITNSKNIKTGGYEQTRLIKGSENYRRFDPKYFYMTGINYMLNLYFKF